MKTIPMTDNRKTIEIALLALIVLLGAANMAVASGVLN
jgi:hypothetical protein